MSEISLADRIPLWTILRDETVGVTALVTPWLDYVGALELATLDIGLAGTNQIASLGEAIRSFVSSLEDETVLHFLYWVDHHTETDIADYERTTSAATGPLATYVSARAAWLRQQKLRRTRLALFFSLPPTKRPFTRGLGNRILFANVDHLTEEVHRSELERLAQLRDRLSARLLNLHISSRELTRQEVRTWYFHLLNPSRARAGSAAPTSPVRDNIFAEKVLRRPEYEYLAEYTEAEQLLAEDIEDKRDHLKNGNILRRVLTLKALPEGRTCYFNGEPLFCLATPSPEGNQPFPYLLAVTVQVRVQRTAKRMLNVSHGLVTALSAVLPFLQNNSIAKTTEDHAKQQSIAALFQELSQLSTKLAALSVSLLLDADSVQQLDARTEAAISAFNALGNSPILPEVTSQLPAFLSLLPGSGPAQLRRKGCTSRNAADFLPLFAPWKGCARAGSLQLTPGNDVFRLDLFDKSIATAHHGIVIADTGSGKSFTLGALVLDALAAGIDAILIDNGASWKPLTELMGGTYLSIDLNTPITPFFSLAEISQGGGEAMDTEALESVVAYLEICVSDRTLPGLSKLQKDIVGRAVRTAYHALRDRADERPLVSHFRDALLKFESCNADDRAIAVDIARRLNMFCDGLYADMLNRPSRLRFDDRILTFDMAKVSKNPTTRSIATATIVQAINSRAASRRNRAIVPVDEAHEYLGAENDAGQHFIESSYRVMRKYNVAMWSISQKFRDFVNAKAGPAIIGNSTLKIFLRHDSGHEEIAQYFRLTDRATQAFKRLDLRAGYHSDFLLMYGPAVTVVRLAPHPLAYWILTTDAEDRALIERAADRNPLLDRFQLLSELAARYPRGVTRPI